MHPSILVRELHKDAYSHCCLLWCEMVLFTNKLSEHACHTINPYLFTKFHISLKAFTCTVGAKKKLTLRFRATKHFIVFVLFSFRFASVLPFRFVSVFRADSRHDRQMASRKRCTRTTTHDHYSCESAPKPFACCGGL